MPAQARIEWQFLAASQSGPTAWQTEALDAKHIAPFSMRPLHHELLFVPSTRFETTRLAHAQAGSGEPAVTVFQKQLPAGESPTAAPRGRLKPCPAGIGRQESGDFQACGATRGRHARPGVARLPAVARPLRISRHGFAKAPRKAKRGPQTAQVDPKLTSVGTTTPGWPIPVHSTHSKELTHGKCPSPLRIAPAA